uniref:Uncharacterized protein n=1 Tax=Cucumis melo TaxID=3656 RepID=A0A9I9E422_CUCME
MAATALPSVFCRRRKQEMRTERLPAESASTFVDGGGDEEMV